MAERFKVTFTGIAEPVEVKPGASIAEAASLVGRPIGQPCGGQGRCGRCIVRVEGLDKAIVRRSSIRLSAQDIARGDALACQTFIYGDVGVDIPHQEKLERKLKMDRTASMVHVPAGYDVQVDQTIRRIPLSLTPPSMDDQTDDWSRLRKAISQQGGLDCRQARVSLPLLRKMGAIFRSSNWTVTAIVDSGSSSPRLIDLLPGKVPQEAPLWGAAIDIGTTTVTVWLVNLLSGEVCVQEADYNHQIQYGEDVISRIIYAGKNHGGEELRLKALETINNLLDQACDHAACQPGQVYKAAITGNSTMTHLLLGIPPESIRLMPFITAVNQPPLLRAIEMGLAIHPDASVDCLPGVASYVGSDISAGVLSSAMADSDRVSLFIDIGTNGEMVLGSHDWLATCASSAGPAFEGAGMPHGMRASPGAIEEVWINQQTYECTYRVIDEVKPCGLCGSGLISLLAELFLAGVIDKGGNFNLHLQHPRLRQGERGPEYVVAWGLETEHGEDIAISRTDVNNLLRTKAAIYAGFLVLAERVGVSLDQVQQVLIGGSFGKYINLEKAIQIGLLPDMPWERFSFLGNTSVQGAYLALLDSQARNKVSEIAARMTYIELSADNSFYQAFTSALFLPHTDLSTFPSVQAALQKG
jgi:uncharacterized 2Fe-2S/4Fe-4S cluster protein (DUF4445 family)